MHQILLAAGAGVFIAGAVIPSILPSLPEPAQGSALAPIGDFIIDYQTYVLIFGIILILLGIFFIRG